MFTDPENPLNFQFWNKTFCPRCFLGGCIQVPVFTKPTHLPSLSLAPQSSSSLTKYSNNLFALFFYILISAVSIVGFFPCFSFLWTYWKETAVTSTCYHLLHPSALPMYQSPPAAFLLFHRFLKNKFHISQSLHFASKIQSLTFCV